MKKKDILMSLGLGMIGAATYSVLEYAWDAIEQKIWERRTAKCIEEDGDESEAEDAGAMSIADIAEELINRRKAWKAQHFKTNDETSDQDDDEDDFFGPLGTTKEEVDAMDFDEFMDLVRSINGDRDKIMSINLAKLTRYGRKKYEEQYGEEADLGLDFDLVEHLANIAEGLGERIKDLKSKHLDSEDNPEPSTEKEKDPFADYEDGMIEGGEDDEE